MNESTIEHPPEAADIHEDGVMRLRAETRCRELMISNTLLAEALIDLEDEVSQIRTQLRRLGHEATLR